MQEKWEIFREEVQSKLQPILNQAGYTLTDVGLDEDNDGFLFMFEKDSTHRISIDVLEQPVVEAGSLRSFNWLRVDIAGKYLKEFVDEALDPNLYLQRGWIWVSAEELDKCIDEIAKGLRAYFEAHPK